MNKKTINDLPELRVENFFPNEDLTILFDTSGKPYSIPVRNIFQETPFENTQSFRESHSVSYSGALAEEVKTWTGPEWKIPNITTAEFVLTVNWRNTEWGQYGNGKLDINKGVKSVTYRKGVDRNLVSDANNLYSSKVYNFDTVGEKIRAAPAVGGTWPSEQNNQNNSNFLFEIYHPEYQPHNSGHVYGYPIFEYFLTPGSPPYKRAIFFFSLKLNIKNDTLQVQYHLYQDRVYTKYTHGHNFTLGGIFSSSLEGKTFEPLG